MKTDFNNTTLLRELKDELGWKIDYVTFWTWVKKKYVGPSSYVHDGTRLVPIYYRKDFNRIVTILKLLQNAGKIRIKGFKQSN